MNKNRLINVFVKNPRMGRVKTRLAAAVGDQRALKVYDHLLKLTAAAAVNVQANRIVLYSDAVCQNDHFDDALFKKEVQQGEDLGERMLYSVANGFDSGYEQVVVIGSDCPDITGELLEQAFSSLNKADSVIGPSADGGYYLIGVSVFEPEVFKDIAWSTPEVYPATLSILKKKGLSVAVLEELNDIDTEEDLKRSRLSSG
ncbi:TIGR04282 family arsenosugar biosynthesis glycosyltransferase [Rhodohalobacter mucosus]|uniref:Glycosyltransferase n=1 Tax=Rhodohalobacter mucosus TaxID=2079485 RepID=A0A316TZJ6_9BACT|nr:TIGR04282 family arsenosugar biosynthesis glycosyltransferase [Rhodohalobacter mucosus]PWN05586.1 glycosyltransferase [Rhodohalobacter mucosus]